MRVPGIAAARLFTRAGICRAENLPGHDSPGGSFFSPHPAVIAHKADAARDAGVCVNG